MALPGALPVPKPSPRKRRANASVLLFARSWRACYCCVSSGGASRNRYLIPDGGSTNHCFPDLSLCGALEAGGWRPRTAWRRVRPLAERRARRHGFHFLVNRSGNVAGFGGRKIHVSQSVRELVRLDSQKSHGAMRDVQRFQPERKLRPPLVNTRCACSQAKETAQLRRLPSAIRLASILARKPGVDMHARISSRLRQAHVGFQRTDVRCSPPHGWPSLSPHLPLGRRSTRASACAPPSRKAARHHTRVPERRPHRGTPHHRTAQRHTCAGVRVPAPPAHRRTSGTWVHITCALAE